MSFSIFKRRRIGPHARNPHSVFLKLIGIFLLVGLLLNLLGFAFFRLNRSWQEENKLESTAIFLLESTIIRMGTPPDISQARKLFNEQQLALAYTSSPGALVPESPSGYSISQQPGRDGSLPEAPTGGSPGNFNFLSPDTEFEDEDFTLRSGNVIDFHEGTLTARIHREEGTYWIQYNFGGPGGNPWGFVAFLIILSVVLLLAYFLMRKTLGPLKALMIGVQETSRGNLDYRIQLHRRDELGQLASLYNEMQEKVQSMLESRMQLLLDVSHEIRTPLTRMKLSLEFIPESDRTKSLKEEIRVLDTMLTEVLENERLSSLHGAIQLEAQDLTPTLEQCLRRFSDAGIEIEHSLSELVVPHDSARLSIAVQNLLENAIRHTDPANRQIRLGLSTSGGNAIIVVQDNGSGIPLDEQKRIFEPFYRKESSSRGFGLGLSLVHRIVESHGGHIDLDSDSESGTRFTIYLPLEHSGLDYD
ncbi:MAG: hypothetical protein CMF59_00700 [Leptospiraceae bacterium]|nr:hypothetical protein [Leptospiraceae bacterium]